MCLRIEVHRPECVLAKGEHYGFEWVVVHNNMGYRCGYVRVPIGHPWHGKDYDDLDPDVHGGLTFAEADVDCDKEGDDNAWWVGFDCAHGGDAPDPELPGNSFARRSLWHVTVRTQEYVEDQCRKLCEQAAAAEVKECDNCGGPIGRDKGPPDGWQLEDGRTVCHACCVADTGRVVESVIREHRSQTMRLSDP